MTGLFMKGLIMQELKSFVRFVRDVMWLAKTEIDWDCIGSMVLILIFLALLWIVSI
jgi:hypothetical protein